MANGNGNGKGIRKTGHQANLDRLAAVRQAKQQAFLAIYAKIGLIGKSAKAVEITGTTIANWRKDDPEFDAEVARALKDYCERIEREIHRRAIVGTQKPIFYQGVQCGSVREYSDRMLELLAKRHIPEYRDRHQVDVSLPGGVLAVPGMVKDSRAWEEEHSGEGNRSN